MNLTGMIHVMHLDINVYVLILHYMLNVFGMDVACGN